MSDEEIIKRRLLIDGDGTGDDRRLNMLLKQFLKWCQPRRDAPENNQIIFDRLLAQMAQCTFASDKAHHVNLMIKEELENYARLSDSIDQNIEEAKKDIEESKCELTLARRIRKNRIEYDMLAKLITIQPDRKESLKQLELLKQQLADLGEEKRKLDRKMHYRRNDFNVLMHTVFELQEQLDKDSSGDEGPDFDQQFVDSAEDLSEDDRNSQYAVMKRVKIKEYEELKMSVNDDGVVLQLSYEKDENVIKSEDTEILNGSTEKPCRMDCSES